MYSLFEFVRLSFKFSLHLVLNRNVAFKILLSSIAKSDNIENILLKSFRSSFTKDDLLKSYSIIFNLTYGYEGIDIDLNLPRKMNTLINFSNSQKAVSFLYNDYNICFIEEVVGKSSMEVKNDIMIAARKFNEVYI